MSLAFKAQGIAVAAVLQIVYLPVTAIVLARVYARTRVEGADLEACFAQNLHGSAAAGAGSHHKHVVEVVGQRRSPR